MASLGYAKTLRRWRVRWRATNRKTSEVFKGSKVFLEKSQAAKFFADIEEEEKLWRYADGVFADSFRQALDDFLHYCKRHTTRTQQHYRMVLTKFLNSINVNRPQQIRPETIKQYLGKLNDSGLTNRTLNAHLTAIKSFCRYFSQRYNIANPASAVKMLHEDPPKARFLTPEEMSKLQSLAAPLIKNRLIFLANTGLRASEFAALDSDCFDIKNKTLTITGKGRKRRTLPLNKTALEVLPRLKTATPNALWLQFSRLAKRAGVVKFGPHAIRHYFATQLLLKGVPLITVSKLLGHKSTRTTEQCYAHILTADLIGSTDILD